MRVVDILMLAAQAVPLLAFPAMGREPDSSNDPVVVVVALHFEGLIATSTLSDMQYEVERIMRLAGLKLQWWLPHEKWFGTGNRLISVRLKGRCEMPSPERPDYSPQVLGGTWVVDGHIIPFCYVDCNRVIQYITQTPITAPFASFLMCSPPFLAVQRLLGRALGRVVAHEMYHILAGTSQHGQEGIARATMGPAELFHPVMDLHPEDAERIRKATFASSPTGQEGISRPQ